MPNSIVTLGFGGGGTYSELVTLGFGSSDILETLDPLEFEECLVAELLSIPGLAAMEINPESIPEGGNIPCFVYEIVDCEDYENLYDYSYWERIDVRLDSVSFDRLQSRRLISLVREHFKHTAPLGSTLGGEPNGYFLAQVTVKGLRSVSYTGVGGENRPYRVMSQTLSFQVKRFV
jgi:hypothetical protein